MSGARADSPRLRHLTLADESVARDAQRELVHDRFEFLLFFDEAAEWSDYVASWPEAPGTHAGARDPAVPSTFLVGEVDGQIIGRVSIRFGLNDWLFREGGHIGYAVRPMFRGRGYAGAMLEQAIGIARANGVESVLMVCDDDNAASARVIERAGGILENRLLGDDGVLHRRYWIA